MKVLGTNKHICTLIHSFIKAKELLVRHYWFAGNLVRNTYKLLKFDFSLLRYHCCCLAVSLMLGPHRTPKEKCQGVKRLFFHVCKWHEGVCVCFYFSPRKKSSVVRLSTSWRGLETKGEVAQEHICRWNCNKSIKYIPILWRFIFVW